MKEFFARLNSMERRFVIAVLVVVFIVINVLFVWPRFNDWTALGKRMEKANKNLADREKVIRNAQALQPKLDLLIKVAGAVPPEDQENELLRTINTTAIECGVTIMNNSTVRQTGVTNAATQFFSERIQQVNVVSGEPQLVDFLHKLGAGNSPPISVREMALNPDAPRYQLQANLKLVASFQKKAPARVTAPATNAPAAKSPPKTTPPLTKNAPTNPAPTTARPQSQKK
jgi:hypothetical protein